MSRALACLAAALSFAYALRGRVFGIPFTALELALVALVIVYVVEKVLSGETFPDPRRIPYFWPLLLLLVAATISLALSPDRTGAAGIWKAFFIEPALGAYIVVDVFRSRAHAVELVLGFFAAGFVVSILNGLLFLLALHAHRPNLTEEPVYVLYNTPNSIGLFLGPLFVMAAALVLFGNRRERALATVFCVIAGPALAVSFSRGAWLGVAAALVLLALIHPRRIWLLGGIVACGIGALLLPPVRRRVSHLFNPTDPYNSINTRVAVWKATVRMLTTGSHPIFGGGLDGFREVIVPYRTAGGFTESLQYPHNFFLNFWTETGLLGLAAIVWLILDVARRCYVALRARTPLFAYHAAIAAAWVTILVHGQIDVPILKNDLAWMTMALLGLHAAILRLDGLESVRSPSPLPGGESGDHHHRDGELNGEQGHA